MPVILKTSRLVLREFGEDDWPTVLEYQRDPRYHRHYASTDRTADEVREFLGTLVADQARSPRLRWQLAITLTEEGGRLIGNCGLRLDGIGATSGDLGYELDPRYWGRGIATEAATEMVRFGFEDQGLHRIWAWCVAENRPSARVLTKVGMQPEGRAREVEWFKGAWHDNLTFGILDREWRETRSGPVRSGG